MSTLMLKEKYRKLEVACPECGVVEEFGNGDEKCIYCGTKHCFDRHEYSCFKTPKSGDIIFPCLKKPICEALRRGDENWREVKPLDEVPYQVTVK